MRGSATLRQGALGKEVRQTVHAQQQHRIDELGVNLGRRHGGLAGLAYGAGANPGRPYFDC